MSDNKSKHVYSKIIECRKQDSCDIFVCVDDVRFHTTKHQRCQP